jgi:hypothetical protein
MSVCDLLALEFFFGIHQRLQYVGLDFSPISLRACFLDGRAVIETTKKTKEQYHDGHVRSSVVRWDS